MLSKDNTNMAVDNAAATTQAANAHTNTHAASASDTTDIPICYFLDTLPRELRDMVYGYLGADYTAVQPTKDCASKIRLKDGPRLAVLLVNKQVSAEYWKMCEEMTELVVVDVYRASNIDYPAIPNTLIKAKTAHALLLVACDNCLYAGHNSRFCCLENFLTSQITWLHEFMADMPYITELYVKIHFPWPYDLWLGLGNSTEWPQSPYTFGLAKALKPFAEVRGVAKVTAIGHNGDKMIEGRGKIAADALGVDESHRYACWTKEKGWDGLSGEQTQPGQVPRRDNVDLEGFEYRADHTDAEDEEDDESVEDEDED